MTSRSLTVRLLHGVCEDTLPRLCGQCQGEGLLGFPLTWIPAGSYNSLNDRAFFDSRGPGSMSEFTHFNESGRARMVDVSEKAATHRTATAQARILMQPETLEKIRRGKIAKGDVLAVAQTAGIMGAKRTPDLIPMCHPILLSSVNIDFKEESQPDASGLCGITIMATVKTTGPTGVEMEALTAVTVAALTIYDMCKAVDRAMRITDVKLVWKTKTDVPERGKTLKR